MGYSVISTATRRRCYLHYTGRPLYPNLFAMLVGPPGGGKTIAIKAGKELIQKLPSVKLAPNIVTKEKFIRLMMQAGLGVSSDQSQDMDLSKLLDYTCAYGAFIEELGTFIRKDEEFIRVLTDLYDSHDGPWRYETKSSGVDILRKIYLNLVGGITPASLADDLGDIALNMGFFSRFLLVFSDHKPYVDPFATDGEMDSAALLHDLEIISRLEGRFAVVPAARDIIREKLRNGLKPLPEEARLASYNARRELHWIKMAMIQSLAKRSTLEITAEDVDSAWEFLLRLEKDMPKALEFFGGNSTAAVVRSIFRWAKVIYGPKKNLIPESLIRQQLVRDIPPQYHDQTIQMMILAQYFFATGQAPARMFSPNMDKE